MNANTGRNVEISTRRNANTNTNNTVNGGRKMTTNNKKNAVKPTTEFYPFRTLKIERVSIGNTIHIKQYGTTTIKKHVKTLKVSDRKVFRLVKDAQEWAFEPMKNKVKIITASGLVTVKDTNTARRMYKGLVENGFEKADKKTVNISDSKDYKELTKDCHTIVDKYQECINNAETVKEMKKIIGWIEKDSRLTEEERNDLGWDANNTMYHMGDIEGIVREFNEETPNVTETVKKDAKKTAKATDSKASKRSGTKKNAKGKGKKKTSKKNTKKDKVGKMTVKNTETGEIKKVDIFPTYILKNKDSVCMFIVKNRGMQITLDGTVIDIDKASARKMYKALMSKGYKRVA